MKLVAMPLTLTALALAVTACGAGTATASADAVAEAAADSLEKQLGQRPAIDCGDEPVTLEEGKTVDCVLTEPATGDLYDTTVTITNVDGGKWKAEVKVAETPRGGESAPPPSESPAQSTLTVGAQEVADAAAEALEAKLGKLPTIDCGAVDLVLSVGRDVYCTLLDEATGDEYETTVKITGITGTKWTFTVNVAPDPS